MHSWTDTRYFLTTLIIIMSKIIQIKVTFDRYNKLYRLGDILSGNIIINSNIQTPIDGILGVIEGRISLNYQKKFKDIQILWDQIIISGRKDLTSENQTLFPFKYVLRSGNGKSLPESYHGLTILIKYSFQITIRQPKDENILSDKHEFHLVSSKEDFQQMPITKAYHFQINHHFCANKKLKLCGYLKSHFINIEKPIEGDIWLVENTNNQKIKSIDLQLLRDEEILLTINGWKRLKEISLIQKIRISEVEPKINQLIPLFMYLPKYLSCASTNTSQFRISFHLKILLTINEDIFIEKTIPINVFR